MVATTIQRQPENSSETQPEISWEEFEKEYLSRSDQFKYEWVNGRVVKKLHMNQHQYFLLDNIFDHFLRLKQEGKVSGKLYTEIDTFFLRKHHRRPDMAWFSDEQVARMQYRENQIPKWVIEVISDIDIADDLLDKISEYEDAKVEVLWLVSANLQQVHIYNPSGKLTCRGDMICSAAPVLPAFEIPASEIFKKLPRPA